MTFGDRLKAARERTGMSPETVEKELIRDPDFPRRAEVVYKTIYRYEELPDYEHKTGNIVTIAGFAKQYGVTLDELSDEVAEEARQTMQLLEAVLLPLERRPVERRRTERRKTPTKAHRTQGKRSPTWNPETAGVEPAARESAVIAA